MEAGVTTVFGPIRRGGGTLPAMVANPSAVVIAGYTGWSHQSGNMNRFTTNWSGYLAGSTSFNMSFALNNIKYTPLVFGDVDDDYEDMYADVFDASTTDRYWHYQYRPVDGESPKISVRSVKNGKNNLSVIAAPNPASNAMQAAISGLKGHTAHLQLMNMLGQVVIDVPNVSFESGSANVPLDFTMLPSGSYMLHIVEDEGSSVSSMISIQK